MHCGIYPELRARDASIARPENAGWHEDRRCWSALHFVCADPIAILSCEEVSSAQSTFAQSPFACVAVRTAERLRWLSKVANALDGHRIRLWRCD